METILSAVSIAFVLQLLFFILLLFFALQAAFLGYHWFNYGNSKRMTWTALCIYLSGGSLLLITYLFALSAI